MRRKRLTLLDMLRIHVLVSEKDEGKLSQMAIIRQKDVSVLVGYYCKCLNIFMNNECDIKTE